MNTNSIAHLIEASQDDTLTTIWLYNNYPGHRIEFVNGRRSGVDVDERQYNDFIQWLDENGQEVQPNFNGHKVNVKGNSWGGVMSFEETMAAIEYWNAANPSDEVEAPNDDWIPF